MLLGAGLDRKKVRRFSGLRLEDKPGAQQEHASQGFRVQP